MDSNINTFDESERRQANYKRRNKKQMGKIEKKQQTGNPNPKIATLHEIKRD